MAGQMWRVVSLYRVITLCYAAVLIIRDHGSYAHPAGGLAALAVMAVLLPHADEEGLAVVAEGLSRVIPACSVDAGVGVVHPSASIGYTLLHQRSPELRQVLVEAERALNAAKRTKV